MASGGRRLPDAPLEKFYKCHPSARVGTLVCIVCGEFYHTNEFVAKYNAGIPVKFINNSFVICQDHPNLALTAKLPYGSLSKETAEFIAQLKSIDREAIKQEMLQEIENIESNKTRGHNDTVYEDLSEIETLKVENNLLKQLLSEVQEKNQILNELLTKEKTSKSNFQIMKSITYADSLKQVSVKPKTKKVPKIVIKKTNKNDNINLEQTVQKCITSDKTIQTKKISKNKDFIVINCMNLESADKIENALKNKLKDTCRIEKEQIKKPIVKIIGIDNVFQNKEEIENDINQRNFSNMEDKCKVIHSFACPKNTMGAIIEVSANIYKSIQENKSKIFIGYQSCKVFDIINTNPCNKCSRFGHSGKNCQNNATCQKCSGDHTSAECKSEHLKCPNCVFNNDKYKTNYETNHSAIDSQLCSVLQNKIKKYIEATDYPSQPTYQRYFGKLGINFNRQSTERQTIRSAPNLTTVCTSRVTLDVHESNNNTSSPGTRRTLHINKN